METMSDCCEGLRSSLVSRRGLLLGGASFAAWAYLPKFARAADGRDPRLVVVILRGALDGLATVAPIGDPDYAGLHGAIALSSMPAWSSTSAGCQSMVTKPGICSTRRSQLRIAGKVQIKVAAVGDMGVAVQRNIGDRQLPRSERGAGLEMIFHHLKRGIATLHPVVERVRSAGRGRP